MMSEFVTRDLRDEPQTFENLTEVLFSFSNENKSFIKLFDDYCSTVPLANSDLMALARQTLFP